MYIGYQQTPSEKSSQQQNEEGPNFRSRKRSALISLKKINPYADIEENTFCGDVSMTSDTKTRTPINMIEELLESSKEIKMPTFIPQKTDDNKGRAHIMIKNHRPQRWTEYMRQRIYT